MKELLALIVFSALASASGASVKLDYVLNPAQFGLGAGGFGNAICADGNRVAAYQPIADGVVHIFQGSATAGFTKQYTINSPDTTYDNATFGESLGFRGDFLYVGSGRTWRVGAHDGTAYLFNLTNAVLKEEWTESPHWAGYFGMVGGVNEDVLFVCQGENSTYDSISGAFFYRLGLSGTRTPIASIMQSQTSIESWPVVVTHSNIFLTSYPSISIPPKIGVYNILRDASGNFVGVSSNCTILDPKLYATCPFSMAQYGNILAFGNPIYTNGSVSCGAVFIYRTASSNSWMLTTTLFPPKLETNAFFGAALDFSQGKLIVGSPGYNSAGTKRGCIYLYDLGTDGTPAAPQQYQPANFAIGTNEVFGAVLTHTTNGMVVGSSGGSYGRESGFDPLQSIRNGQGALYFLSFEESPWLEIRVSKVMVTEHVLIGHNYVVESSIDLKTWTQVGAQFTATSPSITQELDVDVTGRFFRIREVP